MISILRAADVRKALSIRDLTDENEGPHALQLLVRDAERALSGCTLLRHRAHPVVPIEDNYDRLGYPPDGPARDARYTRYVSETQLLRSHTSAMIPSLLRRVARDGVDDALLSCPGIVYRRDVIDRLHTGEPHQLDLWRVRRSPRLDEGDLVAMIERVLAALTPGRRHRTTAAQHPYTLAGRQIDVEVGDRWIEIGECGLAHPKVLEGAGLEPSAWSGLAMGLGLDRVLMLRKGVDDIRLLRSTDPRVVEQMLDLAPYRAVSRQPAIRRDMSLAIGADLSAEEIGDRVRSALGERAGAIELVELRSETAYDAMPPQAIARIGMRPGQKNVLVRVVLRDLERSLTHDEANELRDRIYAVLHEGERSEWASPP